MKQLDILHDFSDSYSLHRCRVDINPYTIAFIYPHPDYAQPFIIKGGLQRVEASLNVLTLPYVVHESIWKNHKARVTIKRIRNLRVPYKAYFTNHTKNSCDDFGHTYNIQTGKIILSVWGGDQLFEKIIKRVPRSWIVELNQFV